MSEKGIVAGVIIKTKFVETQDKAFQDYINYIDRDNATRNANVNKYALENFEEDVSYFRNYISYMDNPEKTTDLFTADKDTLTDKEKQTLKEVFNQAQTNNSLMWQTVISFDNRWLAENNIYNFDTKEVDEKKLMECARGCMNKMLDNETLSDSAIWSGAIHYNTDNVHIHIATVEPSPTREKITEGEFKGQVRGKFKQSTINAGKRFIVNEILQTKEVNQKINNIIRKDIVAQRQSNPILHDRKLCKQFLEIYSQLPADRRQWNYSNNSLKVLKPKIDNLSKLYIEKYNKKDFEMLFKALSEQEQNYQKAYGLKADNHYRDNKVSDLYQRMGNSILKEMRLYDKNIRAEQALKNNIISSKSNISSFYFRQLLYPDTLEYTIRRLKKNLRNDYEHYKNQVAFQKLEQENENNI